MSRKQTGLGRGLSALLGEDAAGVATGRSGRGVANLPIEHLRPNRRQPRERFAPEQIAELVQSIKEQGILQPILARPRGTDRYEIVAGERRWRAAQKAGVHEVPVVVRDFSDEEALQISIIENVQREDLSPIEEARAYKRLADEWGHTQEKVASLVGKSRPYVANLQRLLGLPGDVQKMVDRGELSVGHARALIGTGDPSALARRILKTGMSVRQLEALIRRGERAGRGRRRREKKDADTRALEDRISSKLGLQVSIDHEGEKKGGKVTIRYKTLEQLDRLLARLESSK